MRVFIIPQLHQNTLQLQEEMKQTVIIRATSRKCISLCFLSFVYTRLFLPGSRCHTTFSQSLARTDRGAATKAQEAPKHARGLQWLDGAELASKQSRGGLFRPQLALDATGNTVLVATEETLDLSVRPKDDSDIMRIRW
jgi:hypothetical protein